MKFIILLLISIGCTSLNAKKIEIEIVEINPNQWTALTKNNVLELHKKYDLGPFLYTRQIKIQSRVIPHSHPVLTLNTRNAEFPNKILSTLLHEQFHWWAEMNGENTDLAINELREIFPEVPTEGVARSKYSTYLHLIICYLEYKAMIHFVGETMAKETINEFVFKDNIYPWIYEQVLAPNKVIEDTIRNNKLLPAPLI